jgi:hypothetical protein
MAGGLAIDNDFERLEIEPDKLRSIIGRLGAVRDDERHRLAHETDSPNGEGRPGEGLRHHLEADARGKAQVGGGEHGHHTRRGGGGGDIHRPNRGVG